MRQSGEGEVRRWEELSLGNCCIVVQRLSGQLCIERCYLGTSRKCNMVSASYPKNDVSFRTPTMAG